jgi:serine protease AprX
MRRLLPASVAQYPHKRTLVRKFLLLFLVASALLLVTRSQQVSPAGNAQTASAASEVKLIDASPADPFNRLNTIVLKDGQIVESYATDLSAEDITSNTVEPISREKRILLEKALPEKPAEKIHPKLSAELDDLRNGLASERMEKVIITFHDKLRVPRFPVANAAESRNSVFNRLAMDQAANMVRQIESARADEYQRLAVDLKANYGADVNETFWLIKGVVAEMPLGAVKSLSSRADVAYIEPSYSGEPPPADGNTANDVEDGRGRIVSDPYFNLFQTTGFIGLLDTGVRTTHTLYSTHLSIVNDCTLNANCTGGNPQDDCWNHGTSSGAIISGNGNLGAAFRGVTGITLDSFKVYPTGCGGLDATSTVRGFQRALAVLDRVIVAETQGGGGATSAISAAADAAFDAGAVVVGANGNVSQVTEVGSPGVAHKAIGVGAVNVQTLATVYQINGPAADGRTKPDIQAPTDTETASNTSDTALRSFGGTSGATPYGGGAAALLRNWLRGANFDIEPGQVYAHMILSGQTPFFNNTNGAGLLNLPTNGTAWFGKTFVGNGGTVNINFTIGAGNNRFDGAIWWPETAAQSHNDVDLSLIDPSGITRASSLSISSVFERARFSGAMAPGTWTLRIRGFSVPVAPQAVYYSAHIRP